MKKMNVMITNYKKEKMTISILHKLSYCLAIVLILSKPTKL